jgi:hypothetical protein
MKESDPLWAWLENGPTVLVNLGTHTAANEKFAVQLAGGLRVLLDRQVDTQVLWKVRGAADMMAVLINVLGHVIDNGRVKIVDWLDTAPVVILEHRNTICSVHHGGANSFYEAVASVMLRSRCQLSYSQPDIIATVFLK